MVITFNVFWKKLIITSSLFVRKPFSLAWKYWCQCLVNTQSCQIMNMELKLESKSLGSKIIIVYTSVVQSSNNFNQSSVTLSSRSDNFDLPRELVVFCLNVFLLFLLHVSRQLDEKTVDIFGLNLWSTYFHIIEISYMDTELQWS